MADVPLNLSVDPQAVRAFTLHARTWQANRYVYPVVSRRSKGISIGVNLNPDKVCNFDCIYCSVDRRVPGAARDVEMGVLRAELAEMLRMVRTGEIYGLDPFDKIPAGLRRLNDIAFSGDGEPTTFAEFPEACRLAAELREEAGLGEVKLVVITNATMFHRPAVREALAFLDTHGGEIWAKLDAGTAAYYELVDRTSIPFSRVLDNLLWCCRERATVIQSLFMRVRGEGPSAEEIAAYVERLAEIIANGGRIKLVQLYTVARATTEVYATALSESELRRIRGKVEAGLGAVPVEIYP